MPDFSEELVASLVEYGRSRMTSPRTDDVREDVLDHAYEEHGYEGDEDALWAAVKTRLDDKLPSQRIAEREEPAPRETVKKAPQWQTDDDLGNVTAPFRFARLNTSVSRLDGPETPLDWPVAGNLSAVIEVEWRVETPLLVGETTKDEADSKGTTVEPFGLGDGWAIPGATLRGAMRAVLEVVGAGRLFQTNRHKRYALRDFQHPEYKAFMERAQRQKGMQAGWLRKDGDGATIEPCDWGFVKIEDIIGTDAEGAIQAFAQLSRARKYGDRNQDWKSEAAFTEPRNFAVAGENQGRPVYSPDDGNKRGHFVFSGPMPKGPVNKKYEYVFFDRSEARVPLAPHVWDTFLTTNCKPSQNKRTPDGGWKDLAPLFEKGGKVPVFYVGDLARNGSYRDFSFGLTRLYRIPHKRSIGDVLIESANAHRPAEMVRAADGTQVLQLAPDFVEHLFGYVYERRELTFGHALGTTAPDYMPPSDIARKGRISFDFAHPVDASKFELWPENGPVRTIMGPPKPSFAPFYLAGTEKDYSAAQCPRLAGRKRYVARYRPDGPDAPRDPLRAMLEAQATEGSSADTMSYLRFLAPKGDARFRGRIHLHNVSEAELGAVLWAITFGGDAEARHLIGRGKAFGAGQVAAEALTLHIRRNDRWDKPDPPLEFSRGDEDGGYLSRFLSAFEDEIARLTGREAQADLRKRPDVAGLLATARPRGWTAPQTAYLPYQRPGEKGQAKAFTDLRQKTGVGVLRNPEGRRPPDTLLPAEHETR